MAVLYSCRFSFNNCFLFPEVITCKLTNLHLIFFLVTCNQGSFMNFGTQIWIIFDTPSPIVTLFITKALVLMSQIPCYPLTLKAVTSYIDNPQRISFFVKCQDNVVFTRFNSDTKLMKNGLMVQLPWISFDKTCHQSMHVATRHSNLTLRKYLKPMFTDKKENIHHLNVAKASYQKYIVIYKKICSISTNFVSFYLMFSKIFMHLDAFRVPTLICPMLMGSQHWEKNSMKIVLPHV